MGIRKIPFGILTTVQKREMELKAAIFDVDGTLLDSMGVWYKATKYFFKKNNIPFDASRALKYQEMTLEESLPDIAREFGLELGYEQMHRVFFDIVRDQYFNVIPLKPYAYEYLRSLHESGIKLAVATSGYEELCRGAFERLGINDMFETIVLSSDIGENKETGTIYRRAADELGCSYSDCMVYEDILGGVLGAKRAGMQVTAVADPSNENITEALIQHADHYITGWSELLKR